MTTITYVDSGSKEIALALNRLGRISLMRSAIRPPARKGLNPVLRQLRRTAMRTHPLSRRRPPEGSSRGPMSKFHAIRTISARSKLIGARTIYDSRRFSGLGSLVGPRSGFVVRGRKTKKRAFYPAAQEYGAKGANPPIAPQRQAARAAEAARAAALETFGTEFQKNYEKVAARVLEQTGVK